ncbi:MAG TPA: glycosyltransferase [Chloroflexaceae bacterium]|nr:glycosyltransferase [Chloroflexaceae bacterium]
MVVSQFSVLIPTRDRRDDLRACLRSLAGQTWLPAEVVIVDSTPRPRGDEAEVYQACAGPVPVRYVHVARAGSAWQRNQGLGLICPASEYLVLLDDDVVLEPDYCAQLVRALDRRPDVVGAVGTITNWQGYPDHWAVQAALRLFMMDGQPGAVLPSGQIGHLGENLWGEPFAIQWLYGGNTIVRRSAAADLRFDPTFERFGGYAFNEDLDFSYALGRRGALLCVPAARLVHKISPAGRPTDDYRFGIAQVANRGLFVRKHLPGPLHFACYLWSMLGTMLINGAMIAAGRSHTRLLGNLIGLALVLSGQVRPAPERGP